MFNRIVRLLCYDLVESPHREQKALRVFEGIF